MDRTDLSDFITLFRGRADCYGSWDGGCVKDKLTTLQFERHLTVGPHIGVYPAFNIDGVAHCVWGCTDIDYDDYDEARRLQDAFLAVDIKAWTEKTRKGWHIWVFSTALVPAVDMRRMFLACHQVANSKPTEVNPKQTTLVGNQVGNYVRLPYPAGDACTERYVVNHGERMNLDVFVIEAVNARAPKERITDLASYYTPPPAPQVQVAAPSHDMAEATRRLSPLGKVVFRNGPIAGKGDRSTALACLAHQCFESGLAAGDALAVMEDADLRWGKFMQRGETGRMELIKLVQRAYGNTLSI